MIDIPPRQWTAQGLHPVVRTARGKMLLNFHPIDGTRLS